MTNAEAISTVQRNRLIHANCIDAMGEMRDQSVDFILTDSPYIAGYKSP